MKKDCSNLIFYSDVSCVLFLNVDKLSLLHLYKILDYTHTYTHIHTYSLSLKLLIKNCISFKFEKPENTILYLRNKKAAFRSVILLNALAPCQAKKISSNHLLYVVSWKLTMSIYLEKKKTTMTL